MELFEDFRLFFNSIAICDLTKSSISIDLLSRLKLVLSCSFVFLGNLKVKS